MDGWVEDLPREITTKLLHMGSREVYEMEQVLLETTTERRYDDPIVFQKNSLLDLFPGRPSS